MRPVPLPSRCARKFAVKLPVICVSADEIGSLLVIVVILHTGFGVQLSDAETDTVTGTSLLFGGQITFGDADTEAIVGGCLVNDRHIAIARGGEILRVGHGQLHPRGA